MRNKSCSWIFVCLMTLGTSAEIVAQDKKFFFEIQSAGTWEAAKVKCGDFLHCIQKDSSGHKAFVFGEVKSISQEGFMLRKNRFLKGSGGFVHFTDVANIEKVRLVRRSILASCIAGIVLGELTVIDGIPKKVILPMMGVATVAILMHTIRHQRKSLYRSRVPDVVIVIPPGLNE